MVRVNVRRWGSGDRHAVLIHGLGNSSESWWQVGPEFARRGFNVHAVDLPGHGASERLDDYSVEALVDAVLDAVPAEPALALGHSLGGLILAHATPALRPAVAVYEDPAWTISVDQAVVDSFRAQKGWTAADVDAAYPKWSEGSKARKLAALQQWDQRILERLRSFTSAQVTAPAVRSIVVLADPSNLVPAARAVELRTAGFEVHTVRDAGHVVHLDDAAGFWEALELARFDVPVTT